MSNLDFKAKSSLVPILHQALHYVHLSLWGKKNINKKTKKGVGVEEAKGSVTVSALHIFII